MFRFLGLGLFIWVGGQVVLSVAVNACDVCLGVGACSSNLLVGCDLHAPKYLKSEFGDPGCRCRFDCLFLTVWQMVT